MKNECPEISQSMEDHSSYEQWFQTKVQEALNDPRPGIPHEEVMREMKVLIESKLSRHPTD